MYENYELKKFGADKIAFLGMFIISLLIAWLIVSINSALTFSEPIELAHSGFSICVPTGKDWQSNKKWQYEDNTFVLSSNLLFEQNLPAIAVNCRYYLTSEDLNPRTWLERQAQVANNAIVEKGEIQKGNLSVHWAHIEIPFTVYWASAELPNNRTIDVEVIQTRPDIDIAEKVFWKVIDKLDFREDNPVKNGEEIVNQVRSRGIDTFIDDHNKEVCFFILDSSGYNVGFTIDQLSLANAADQNDIHGTSQFFFAGPSARQQYTSFRSDKNFSAYTWQGQTIARAGRAVTQIVSNQNGSINVMSRVNNVPRQTTYTNASDIVPSIFLELFVSQFVRDNFQEAVIDVIESSGRVTPALISFAPAQEEAQDVSIAVKLEFMDGRDYSQLLYLDKDGHISKEIMHYEQEYKLEKTDIESIRQQFPGQAVNIIEQNLL
jgi:hypothetical protein